MKAKRREKLEFRLHIEKSQDRSRFFDNGDGYIEAIRSNRQGATRACVESVG